MRYSDLQNPKVSQLKTIFSRLLDIIVAGDTKSTRRDDQLNQICNLILVKLESDKLASCDPGMDIVFQYWKNDSATSDRIQGFFTTLKGTHVDLFANEPFDTINLDNHTIATATYELTRYKLHDVQINVISEAFQVFRTASLKSEEGQYYTPHAVIRSAVKFMDIQQTDLIIDPACGTGGFLFECYRQLRDNYTHMSDGDAKGWAQRHLYGIDKDRINVKLTKAMMLIIGDGSTHTFVADSLRVTRWREAYPELVSSCIDGQYSCVITNPPFGINLTFSKLEGSNENYEVCRKPKKSSDANSAFMSGKFEEREIGIVFLERCYRLLREGGKLGIVLPETYFFSPSYIWLQGWIHRHFNLLGMLNIPMEAFQGFCRAKTNFYVFQKKGATLPTDPRWAHNGYVISINAPTCGINKDGEEQYIVNPNTGQRTAIVDDKLWDAVSALKIKNVSDLEYTCSLKEEEVFSRHIIVPSYFDDTHNKRFESFISKLNGFNYFTIGELREKGLLEVKNGHGSPSQDQRVGEIPYVKVSDLRAGLVNINPTNLVPLELARTYWKKKGQQISEANSGLKAYDIISPERASKNIGEFCTLLPGQEQLLLTKEVIILRASKNAPFDQFYLMWAMSLSVVRNQWRRIVFMQTNREDVGKRYMEIIIPVPKNDAIAASVATPFREYFTGLQTMRKDFNMKLNKSGFDHHIFYV